MIRPYLSFSIRKGSLLRKVQTQQVLISTTPESHKALLVELQGNSKLVGFLLSTSWQHLNSHLDGSCAAVFYVSIWPCQRVPSLIRPGCHNQYALKISQLWNTINLKDLLGLFTLLEYFQDTRLYCKLRKSHNPKALTGTCNIILSYASFSSAFLGCVLAVLPP